MPTFRYNSKRSTGYTSNWGSGGFGGGNSNNRGWGSGLGTGRGTTTRGNTGRGNWVAGRSSTRNTTTYSPNSPQFNPIKTECQARIGSYKNVYSQFSGSGKTIFSPSIANRWLRFCNNGTLVYKFTNPQFVRCFGSSASNLSSVQCTKFFQRRFGVGIKAVCRGNSNCWLVAATPNVTATPFRNYDWV